VDDGSGHERYYDEGGEGEFFRDEPMAMIDPILEPMMLNRKRREATSLSDTCDDTSCSSWFFMGLEVSCPHFDSYKCTFPFWFCTLIVKFISSIF
jgi:hypothetical protein